MASTSGTEPLKEKIKKFWQSEEQIPSTVREIVSVLVTVGIIVAILFLVCGTWPAIVTIESESMVPNMNVGDLVLVMAADRLAPLQSMAEGNTSGYEKFAKPGDVIIYRPNGVVNYPRSVIEPRVNQNFISNLTWEIRTLMGFNQVHPIIHRALQWVEQGESYPMLLPNGSILEYIAPNSGYITKGDNQATNKIPDQIGFGNSYRGLGAPLGPVKTEWIVGKAVFSIPLVGILPLHIKEVIVIVVAIMIIHELYLRSRQKSQPRGRKKQK